MKTPRASTQDDNLQIKMYSRIVPGPEETKPGTFGNCVTLDPGEKRHQKIFSRKLYNARCQDPME